MNSIQVLQVLQARFGSANWNDWHIYRQPIYDFIRYTPAGVTQLNFFQVALGTADPVSTLAKTLEQTNLNKPQSVGQNYFIAQELRCDCRWLPKPRQPTGINNDADVLWTTMTDAMSVYTQLLRLGVLTLTIGDKTFFEVQRPFTNAPPGYGVDIVHHAARNLASTLGERIWVQPDPSRKNVMSLTPPQLIEPEQTSRSGLISPKGRVQ